MNDGSGSWTPSARRGGTASSAGTSITVSGAVTSLFSSSLMAAYRAVVNDLSTNGDSAFPSFYINIVDDGSNSVFTPTARRNGTASSGGTALTIPWVTSTGGGAGSAGLTKSNDFKVAFEAAMRAVINDRSTNG